MEYFLQQLINGLTLGSIYGLIAIGYTMVYGIIGMINFAHGDIFMVGSFLALITFLLAVAAGVTAVPLALLLVIVIAMTLTALYGWTVERIAYRPLRHSFRLAPLDRLWNCPACTLQRFGTLVLGVNFLGSDQFWPLKEIHVH